MGVNLFDNREKSNSMTYWYSRCRYCHHDYSYHPNTEHCTVPLCICLGFQWSKAMVLGPRPRPRTNYNAYCTYWTEKGIKQCKPHYSFNTRTEETFSKE
jgi:hypothetical protein